MKNIKYDEMKEIVKKGYDSNKYSDFYRKSKKMNRFEKLYFDTLINNLPKKSAILDLGCGTGMPYDLYLSTNSGYDIKGIDISEAHINMAKKNISKGNYIKGDFTKYDFQNEKYDAVIAIYSIFHIPREEHNKLIKKIHKYLKKNGYILITMGVRETDGIEIEDDFCGNTRMAWSHYDYKKNIELINNNGFRIIKYDNENDFGSDEHHLWILAQKT